MSAKPQPVQYGDRQVYSVAGFNHGVGGWLQRLPEVWVDGEVAEMKKQSGWTYAYLTLKDPGDGASLQALVARSRLEAIRPPLRPGDRVPARGAGRRCGRATGCTRGGGPSCMRSGASGGCG